MLDDRRFQCHVSHVFCRKGYFSLVSSCPLLSCLFVCLAEIGQISFTQFSVYVFLLFMPFTKYSEVLMAAAIFENSVV